MTLDPNWWDPVMRALNCIIDTMPPDRQKKVVDQLQLMATACANRGDTTAEYFCRALSGEEYQAPAPKPRDHLKLVK